MASRIPPSKRNPFEKLPVVLKKKIDEYSASTVDINVRINSNYGAKADFMKYHMWDHKRKFEGDIEDTAPRRYTAAEIRKENDFLQRPNDNSWKWNGYWKKKFFMSVDLDFKNTIDNFHNPEYDKKPYVMDARKKILNRFKAFCDRKKSVSRRPIVVDSFSVREYDVEKSPQLNDSITRNYDTKVEGINGDMEIKLPITGDKFSEETFGLRFSVQHKRWRVSDSDGILLFCRWVLPYPLHLTDEWWDKAHSIMTQDVSRYLESFMKQVFSDEFLDFTDSKLVNESMLKKDFWLQKFQENAKLQSFPNRDWAKTETNIRIQRNKKTKITKGEEGISVYRLKLKVLKF